MSYNYRKDERTARDAQRKWAAAAELAAQDAQDAGPRTDRWADYAAIAAAYYRERTHTANGAAELAAHHAEQEGQ